MTGPVINFNDLNVPVDRTPMDRDFFNSRFLNVVGAINGLAARQDTYDLAVSSLVSLGMDRVNTVLGPLLDALQTAAQSGFLTATAAGVSHSLTEGVDVAFTITSGGQTVFTPTPYVLALDETDSTNWGILSVNNYNNVSGVLSGHCIYSNNGPQASSTWSLSAQSALIAAQLTMLTETVAARTATEAAAATVTIDYDAIEAAIAAIETGPVISVAGKVGVVSLVAADIAGVASTAALAAAVAALGTASGHAATDFLLTANNLSDVVAATARTNLGLGSAATHAVTDVLQVSNNLSDVVAATARTNLGLGTAATHPATDFLASTFPLSGGAAVTSQSSTITLTAASLRSQNVAFTTMAQAVILPDATTYTTSTLGGPIFAFYNGGDFAFAIRRSDLTILCVLAPGGSAEIYLDGNSTAAGPWRASTAIGPSLLGGLVCLDTQMSSTYTAILAASYNFISLSNTLALAFLGNSGNSNTYVVAIDASTYPATIGTPVLIDTALASNSGSWSVGTSATTAQIAWFSTSSLFKTAVVSVSGTVVTINTPATNATVNLGSSGVSFSNTAFAPQVGVAGQYAALCYLTPAQQLQVLPIFWNGTTSSIGTVVTFGTGTGCMVIACYPVDATHVLIVYIDNAGGTGPPFSLRAAVATLSGTTSPAVSVGTSAGINSVIASAPFGAGIAICQLSSNLYVAVYQNSSTSKPTAVSISISGTTVTFGTPVVVENVTATVSQGWSRSGSFKYQPSLFKLTATTALLNYVTTTIPTVVRHVVITNTAGVITIGAINYGMTPSSATVTGATFPLTAAQFACFAPATAGPAGALSGVITGVAIGGTTISYAGMMTGPEWTPAAAGGNTGCCVLGSSGLVVAYAGLEPYVMCVVRFKDGVPIPVGRLGLAGANSSGPWWPLSSTKMLMMGLPQNQMFSYDGNINDASLRISVVEFPS